MALTPGALVEIKGMRPQDISAGFRVRQASPEKPGAAINGAWAQLVEFQSDAGKWLLSTFDGIHIGVGASFLTPLSADQLSDFDLVLGPAPVGDASAEHLATCLGTKGYAVVRNIVQEGAGDEMLEVARRLDDNGHFARFAWEFERGYFGVDGTAKAVQLGFSAGTAPEYVKGTALEQADKSMETVCDMLTGFAEELLGFVVHSRSDMILRMPLAEENEDQYPPGDFDDKEAEDFMHMMYRKKVTAIQFAGPSSGSMTLLPQRELLPEVQLSAEPHTTIIIAASFYDYTYEPGDKTLAMQCFYLRPPTLCQAPENAPVCGVEHLHKLETAGGPPPPAGAHISVDSMYCRYGGSSDGYEQYWLSLGKAGTDAVSHIPEQRWDHSLYYDPDNVPSSGGRCYTRHGCFGVDHIDMFDCRFFDISPNEAKLMSPIQRQVMEVSYMALSSGGYQKADLMRKPAGIGHFVGCDKDDWMTMSYAEPAIAKMMSGGFAATAATPSIVSNRFSFSLNLKGPSMTIDTACSSSLVSTHVAKFHLRDDNDVLEAAIVNGTNLLLHPGAFCACAGAGMISAQGRCFTFNSTADGYLRGELSGAMCLKRKQYDEASFALLSGSQVNQDGRSASLTAPNGPSQEKCILASLKDSNVARSDVGIFECHGTGTPLGDPIETGSMKKVLNTGDRSTPLVVGSSKSNIGHGEGGAGLAGFLKCCLQVTHVEGAPNAHLHSLNPHINMDAFPSMILSESTEMIADSAYAGVSSFGFGGTNSHCQAWGKNVFTTRGLSQQSPQSLFHKHLAKAPHAEIIVNGDDVRDWETTGVHPEARPGARYRVEIDEHGIATWEPEDEEEDYFESIYVRGSHNSWTPEVLARHEEIEGLHTGTITVGRSGSVQFQVIADEDEGMVFHPGTHDCTSKAAPVLGPEQATKDKCWLLRGRPNQTFRIEFYERCGHTSLVWLEQ